jgi:tetratricopeptide (TPR) repeat protein
LETARAQAKWAEALENTGRLEEAIAGYLRAEELYRKAGDTEAQWLMLSDASEMYTALGRAQEGVALLRPLLETAHLDRPSRGLATMQIAMGLNYWSLDQFPEAMTAAERAVHLARAVGDDSLLLKAQMVAGRVFVTSGQIVQAQRVWEELLPLAERIGELFLLSIVLDRLAVCASTMGEFSKSLHYADRAVEVIERVGDRRILAELLVNRAKVHFSLGEWRLVYQQAERARTALAGLSGGQATGDPLLMLGGLALAEGRWEEGTALTAEGIRLAERYQNFNRQRIGEQALAERELVEGRPQAARSRLEPLLPHARQRGNDLDHLLPPLAWAALALGEEDQAEALLAEAVARLTAQRRQALVVEALRIQALLRIRQRRWEESQAALEETLALCRTLPYPYAEAKALYVSGLVHQAKGEPVLARQRLEEALAILNRLGERLYAEQVERALAEGRRS